MILERALTETHQHLVYKKIQVRIIIITCWLQIMLLTYVIYKIAETLEILSEKYLLVNRVIGCKSVECPCRNEFSALFKLLKKQIEINKIL